jgi:hypothetical protein
MSPEVSHNSPERSRVEVGDAAGERTEALRSLEKSAEQAPEKQQERVESARHEAREVLAQEPGKERRAYHDDSTPQPVAAVDRNSSYNTTMQRVRTHMSVPARTFSKFIHTPGVERSSEVIGSTFARPNAIVAGSGSALICVSALYFTAKLFGYPLSGFETIGAFVLGWLVGLIYDYTRVMITGHR